MYQLILLQISSLFASYNVSVTPRSSDTLWALIEGSAEGAPGQISGPLYEFSKMLVIITF